MVHCVSWSWACWIWLTGWSWVSWTWMVKVVASFCVWCCHWSCTIILSSSMEPSSFFSAISASARKFCRHLSRLVLIFGRLFVKRFVLCYQSVVLSVPSVCNVGVLWPNGWMDQDATWYVDRPWPRPHCVRWGPNSPTERGTATPDFCRL